jgi:hypothetical protein
VRDEQEPPLDRRSSVAARAAAAPWNAAPRARRSGRR